MDKTEMQSPTFRSGLDLHGTMGKLPTSTFARTLTFDYEDPKVLTGMQKLAQTQGSGGFSSSGREFFMGESLNATAYKTKKIKCLKPENATQFPRNPK